MSAFDLAVGQGFLTVNEVMAIKDIVHRLPYNAVAVNIGSGMATSTIAVLEEINEVVLYDVDLNLANGAQPLREHGYHEDVRLRRIQGDSGEVGLVFTPKIDYLFIDGDHSEMGVRRDCVAWLPHMNPGGYVLFHDYWPYPADHALAGVDYWPDVRRVADELMKDAAVVLDSDRLRVYQVL